MSSKLVNAQPPQHNNAATGQKDRGTVGSSAETNTGYAAFVRRTTPLHTFEAPPETANSDELQKKAVRLNVAGSW